MASTVCLRCRPSAATSRSLLRFSKSASRCLTGFGSTSPSVAPKDPPEVVIFSGIQPTGMPHLGNYFGAMRQWKQLQDSAPENGKLFFSIVDLHAITMPQEGAILRQRSRDMLAALLAIGLDPRTSTMFFQSSVPAHTELMWILSCTASMGYLGRMTQWKSKLMLNDNALPLADNVAARKLKLGLFSYPVLQAADILVHRATHVPVGDDQRQHLEFARECVTNFNHAYGKVLVAPETITTPSPRVMSLTDPTKKMSKSAPSARSRIPLIADEAEIRDRIRTAVTDSQSELLTWDPENRPGVANLLELLSQCDEAGRSPEQIVLSDDFRGTSIRGLKQLVADALVKELEGVREKYFEVQSRRGGKYITRVQEECAEKARKSAAETMRQVRDIVGLAPL